MAAPSIDRIKREFFPQLTSVRFFAAFFVILYHYRDEFSPHIPTFLSNFIGHGDFGVSFFFVLSGFILAANYFDRLLEKRSTKGDFWWARFSRIYPLYLLSIVVFLPRFFLPIKSDPDPDFALYAHGHIPQMAVVVLLLLQSFGFKIGGFLNSPVWSVSTEVFFYVCLPFLLPLLNRIKSSRLMPTMIGLFILSAILPFCYHAQIFNGYLRDLQVSNLVEIDATINQLIRMCFLARLPEFLIGVLSYRFYREVMQNDFKPIYTLWGVLASLPFLIWIFVEPPNNSMVLYTGQVIGTPFCVFVILGLIKSKSKLVIALSSPTWILLGEASFGLYLFHIPIKNFGQFVINHFLHKSKPDVPLSFLLIAVSIGVSIVLFKKFETPTRKRLTVWWKNRQAKKPPDPQLST